MIYIDFLVKKQLETQAFLIALTCFSTIMQKQSWKPQQLLLSIKKRAKTMDDVKNISIRAVVQSDMDAVIELIQSMSEFKPSKSEYLPIWNSFCQQTNVHSLVAVIDNQIVGYGSIVVETKIRGGKMGHIEDIVSHSLFRKKGIGKAIVDALFDVAKVNGCYKVALQCKEYNVKFYEKCGYEVSGLVMQIFVK